MSSSMPRLTSMLAVTLAALTFLTGSGAVKVTIMDPIRSTGKEIGLIFLPGAKFEANAYKGTAQAIQEASEFRVWAALTGDPDWGYLLSRDVYGWVRDATRELEKAGMTSKVYVLVGHGYAGRSLEPYAKKNSDLGAVILMGSTFSRDTKLRDFPVPVLTLAGELDGVTRITRVAVEYEKLTQDEVSFFQGLYRTPVIFIEGANHGQFASGNSPFDVVRVDLPSSTSLGQVHIMIGKYVSDFLTVTFSRNNSQVDAALENLANGFFKSVQKFQPFLDMRDLDKNGEESMWTVLAQELFAGEYGPRVAVSNKIVDHPWFFSKTPAITAIDDDGVMVHTFAAFRYYSGLDEAPYKDDNESPDEIAMKLVSKEAIWKALSSQNDTYLRSEPNKCQTLNRAAVYLALAVSGDAARERYLTQGRPILFEDTDHTGPDFLWAVRSMRAYDYTDGLHLDPSEHFSNGVHYCKVISPYRAMEWVNVDSLVPWMRSGRIH